MPHVRIGLIGGSGLGDALEAEKGERRVVNTPFGEPSSPVLMASLAGTEVAVIQRHGAGHRFNPSSVPYRANIFALKSVGVTHIVASGATGSLREHIGPGDLVLADQFIDKTHRRHSTFFEQSAVHVEFAEPCCPVTRRWLLGASEKLDGVTTHDGGTYVCMEGPAFSTRAESELHRAWGGDLIGMTCMPEAKLAREAEIAYALIGLPTDYDCWKPHEGSSQELLQEIIGNLTKASTAGINLIKSALRDTSALSSTPSPAHSALRLGIWSQKEMIPEAEVERLAVLWGKYFE